MNRRNFVRTLATGLACGALSRVRAEVTQPNIILIMADDLGYGDLGCYGSKLATPSIDRLAAEGVRFTDFYSASPVCSPSRAALLTGRYPVRTGITGVLQAADPIGLPASETTVAQMLRKAGYSTACIGKWHLGAQAAFLPTNRGFDEFFGIPYSNDMWPLPLLRNFETVESAPDASTFTRRFTDEAISFIERAKAGPFFLYFAHSAPHIPLNAGNRFRGKSTGGPYGDSVEEMDWSVGEVLRTVRENGLDDRTLVIFMSDNGPWFQGSPGTLRGRKGETYDGGMRVPFVARFPGTIPADFTCRGMATAMDLLPTFARLGRATLPANVLDGVDISPLLTSEQQEVAREAFLYFNGWDLQCARLGRWKVHFSRYLRTAWNPDPPGGCANLPLISPEVYDLTSDPGEDYDCSAYHPEVVADLRARVEAMLSKLPDTARTAWSDTMKRAVDYSSPGALPIRKSS